jgi:hypothetical protein
VIALACSWWLQTKVNHYSGQVHHSNAWPAAREKENVLHALLGNKAHDIVSESHALLANRFFSFGGRDQHIDGRVGSPGSSGHEIVHQPMNPGCLRRPLTRAPVPGGELNTLWIRQMVSCSDISYDLSGVFN